MVAASKTAVLCALALIASANVIAGAEIKCATDAHCQTAGKYDYYCDTTGTDPVCKQLAAVDEITKAGEICKDTLFGGVSACYNLAQLNCDATDATISCLTGSKKDNKCVWPEEGEKPEVASAKEGDRCAAGGKASETCELPTASNAYLELFCNQHSLCERKNKVGEICSSSNQCEFATACNYGICTAYGTVQDHRRASSALLCESGLSDNDGYCVPTYTTANFGTACFSNADCSATDGGVCDVTTKDAQGRGKCVAVSKAATVAFIKCVGQRCTGYKNNEDCNISASLCAKEWARTKCATECKKPTSARAYHSVVQAKGKANEGKGYAIDCKALTVTTLPDGSCKIGPNDIYKNCDAMVADASAYPRSSADKVAASFMAVVLALVAALAMLF